MKPELSRRDVLKLLSTGLAGQLLKPGMDRLNLRQPASGQPNILIIVFDAWTAKNISFMGYERQTMPALESLLDKAIVFHNHYSAAPFTTPGTASLLTGRYPWSHGAVYGGGKLHLGTAGRNIFRLLEDDYHRVAYSHNSFTDVLLRQLKPDLDQYVERDALYIDKDLLFDDLLVNDFEIVNLVRQVSIFDYVAPFQSSLLLQRIYLGLRDLKGKSWEKSFPLGLPLMGNVALRFVLEEAIDWLGENIRQWPEPFLGYFHFLPPHSPYHTRFEFIDRFKDDGYQPLRKPVHPLSFNYTTEEMDDARKAYDEFLLYVDAEFARLFDQLDRQGILDNTWIFLTSDHGEMFERGEIEHTTQLLHQPVIRVPLMVFAPGQAERVDVYEPTSAVDLLPTILTLAGRQIPEWCDGLPLLGEESGLGHSRPIYAFEAKLNPVSEPLNVFTLTKIQNGYKAMIAEGYDGLEAPLEFAYHLEDDPEELENLLDTDPSTAADLLDDLQAELPEISRRFMESKN